MTDTQVKGFRRDIMVLHALSDLLEKHPDLPRPEVRFNVSYGTKERQAQISWFIHPNYSITSPATEEEYDLDFEERWKLIDARAKELRRVDIEDRIAALVAALGDVEWEKNDPTKSEYYYQLNTQWQGAHILISTDRDVVCQKVVVLETEHEEERPDPAVIAAVTEAAPLVKVMVKDTITEWQCNSRIAAATAPRHTQTVEVLA